MKVNMHVRKYIIARTFCLNHHMIPLYCDYLPPRPWNDMLELHKKIQNAFNKMHSY